VPQILVLDDPLSAVDTRTEQRILEAIDRQRSQRSLILITNRVAAAARCDRILVLDRGRVAEQGTHAQLVVGDRLYAEFVRQQRLELELERLGDAALRAAETGAP
jgi:ATP-binding cassette subfamily B multidrug efflux pump